MTRPQPTPPPVTLASVQWDWGGAYDLGYRDDQWTAARRDGRGVLHAATLTGLETAIQADYRHQPVSRDFDPPGVTGYLSPASLPAAPGDTGEAAGDDAGLDAETLLTVRELRHAYPLWTIIYSTELNAWIGKTRKKTICQHSAASLAITLALIERRERR